LFYEKGNKDYIYPNGDNPFYGLRNTNGFTRDRVFGNASVKYDITDWLYAFGRVGIDYYNEYRTSITQSGTVNNIRRGRGGQFTDTQLNNKETNADFTLNFDKTFGEIRVDGLVGANYRNNKYNNMSMGATDLVVPDLYTISNVKGAPTVSQFKSEYETNSLYFAANASYRNYLFLGVTGRNDWSSSLPEENRSYFYPSASVGFSVTDAFKLESKILSYAKVRLNIAKVGGDTGPYMLSRTYSAGTYNAVATFRPTSTMPPLDLKPEETNSWEIGAETRFFDNRLSIDLTYYDQTTVNQILSVATSTATGYASMLLNAGEIENKGIEIMLNGAVLDKPSGLKWDVTLNWAKNTNTVNALYGKL
jgi:outer membrane receptor protein involved in Fe transport